MCAKNALLRRASRRKLLKPNSTEKREKKKKNVRRICIRIHRIQLIRIQFNAQIKRTIQIQIFFFKKRRAEMFLCWAGGSGTSGR